MFVIPSANSLITFIQDFTGSTNVDEIKRCIFMAELSMRNIELPALRCDPYAPENIGIADEMGRIPIPGDMNKPILFFKQGSQYNTSATATGVQGEFTIQIIDLPNQQVTVGMTVLGSGIGTGATITAIDNMEFTLSVANSGTVDGNIIIGTGANRSSSTGPWIVYDRIGDRDIITQGMIAQLYLQPVNVPAVIRGKFSEVGQHYEFLPYVAEGDLINMYYYKAWPLLFSPAENALIATTGTIDSYTGSSGEYILTITIEDTSQLTVGDTLIATADVGRFGTIDGATPLVTITSITNGTTFVCSCNSLYPNGPEAGSITDIIATNITIQNNAVLATWPEGYVYATLREYYIKRHNDQDAAVYQQKYQDAWNIVEDQNNLGKWSGGHTRLTSVWQPRQYRQYNIK